MLISNINRIVCASNFLFLPVQTLCANSINYAIFGHVLHVTFYGFEWNIQNWNWIFFFRIWRLGDIIICDRSCLGVIEALDSFPFLFRIIPSCWYIAAVRVTQRFYDIGVHSQQPDKPVCLENLPGKKILLFNMKLMPAKIPSECEEIYNYIFTHSLSFFAVKFLLSLISVLSTKMLKPDIIMMQTLRFGNSSLVIN